LRTTNRHARDGVCESELELVGHRLQAVGLLVNRVGKRFRHLGKLALRLLLRARPPARAQFLEAGLARCLDVRELMMW
jgi:hypothetical protein